MYTILRMILPYREKCVCVLSPEPYRHSCTSTHLFIELVPLTSLVHKCQRTHLKAFCTDLWESLNHSYYKSLTHVILLCWFHPPFFLFCLFVTECVGLGPVKGTLGLSGDLTGRKRELQPFCFAPGANLCKIFQASDHFPPHIEIAVWIRFQNNIRWCLMQVITSVETEKGHIEADPEIIHFSRTYWYW